MPSAFSRVTRATDLTSASRQRTLDCGGLKLDIQVSVMGSHPVTSSVNIISRQKLLHMYVRFRREVFPDTQTANTDIRNEYSTVQVMLAASKAQIVAYLEPSAQKSSSCKFSTRFKRRKMNVKSGSAEMSQ